MSPICHAMASPVESSCKVLRLQEQASYFHTRFCYLDQCTAKEQSVAWNPSAMPTSPCISELHEKQLTVEIADFRCGRGTVPRRPIQQHEKELIKRTVPAIWFGEREKPVPMMPQAKRLQCVSIGGASRDRTDDLIVANDALSQLSYSPTRLGKGEARGAIRRVLASLIIQRMSAP
jgi:hypothetical protein